MNKDELLNNIRLERNKLENALDKLPADCLETLQEDKNWTVKETLVHITAWERSLLDDYSRLKRGETVHELTSKEEIDAFNEATRLRAATYTLDQALRDFHQSYFDLIKWLENLPDSELERPFAYGMTLGEFTAEDTWKHYAEHLPLFS